MSTLCVAIMGLLLAISACSPASPAAAPDPDQSATVDLETSGWGADVDAFTAQLEAIHPEPYHSISREAFAAAVLEYKQQLTEMTEWEAVVGFQRLLALLTAEGRDGHMVLRPADRDGLEWRMFPLQLYRFSDGYYVVAARDDPTLVGAKLVRVGTTPVNEAVRVIKSAITKDNGITVRARIPAFLETPDLLAAMGLLEAGQETLTFVQAGSEMTPELETIGVDEHSEWRDFPHPYARRLPARAAALYLRNQQENVWVRFLKPTRTIYIAFNVVHPPFDATIERIDSILDAKRVTRVVLDLRHNPGGETGLYGPMLSTLKDPRVNRPGRLFALTGRVTFSAAANFLADLDNETCALIVGEAPGAAPRFWDDNDPVTLPYSGLEVGVATRWWDKGGKRHPGTTFEVDLPVRYRSAHYFKGMDPVLREAERYRGRGCPAS